MFPRLVVAAVALIGCRVHDLDLTGKACPCPADWFCDTGTQTCTRTDVDAAPMGSDSMGRTYRDLVLADVPVAYWRLDDTTTNAHDELGHFDGTYSGTCTHGVGGALAGDASTATHFDGTSCAITLPDALDFSGTAPYTVEAWLKESGPTLGFRVVFVNEIRQNGPTDGYALVDSGTGLYFERGVNKVVPTTVHVIHAYGNYIHAVGVYNGTSFVMYVDGVAGPVVADARTMIVFSANPLIGSNPTTDYFLGELDEIAIYDHALTPERINAHHNAGINVGN